AGWPMAAMAGALDTVLTKRAHYTLGDGPRTPDAAMVGQARRIARAALLIFVAGVAGMMMTYDTQSDNAAGA
ncbi:MAG: hypothetical protein HGA65_17160, partial [Oscillochloris sp.]|nr:hypothetical protein [Oscillochloris sp.]